MHSSLTILHVLNHSHPYADGYAIRSAGIVDSQRRDGLNPVVLTSCIHEPEFTKNPEYYAGTAYHRIPSPSKDRSNGNLTVVIGLLRHISRIYEKQRFDLIHAHSPSLCGLAALLFSLRRPVPFVYEVRAFWEDAAVDAKKCAVGSFRYRMERALETLILKRARAVTTIAEFLKKDIEKRRRTRGTVFLVPNGVDAEHFRPIPPDERLLRELQIAPTDPVIGYIGSFYRFEGLHVLLHALHILNRRGIRYKAILVGGGEMEAEWRQLSSHLGLSDVRFTGRVPHADVLRYYSIMNLCVYPRLKEQITDRVTPLKPLEAMAMGILVLGSNVGGIRELLGSETAGLLFPENDAEALAQLLCRILAAPSQYAKLASDGRILVEQKHSWDWHAQRYRQIYETALSKTPS